MKTATDTVKSNKFHLLVISLNQQVTGRNNNPLNHLLEKMKQTEMKLINTNITESVIIKQRSVSQNIQG